jgi:Na+/proline symporter
MTTLRRILIAIGFIAGFLLVVGMDAWPSRWLAALIMTFFTVVGGVWAMTYATRNEAKR